MWRCLECSSICDTHAALCDKCGAEQSTGVDLTPTEEQVLQDFIAQQRGTGPAAVKASRIVRMGVWTCGGAAVVWLLACLLVQSPLADEAPRLIRMALYNALSILSFTAFVVGGCGILLSLGISLWHEKAGERKDAR